MSFVAVSLRSRAWSPRWTRGSKEAARCGGREGAWPSPAVALASAGFARACVPGLPWPEPSRGLVWPRHPVAVAGHPCASLLRPPWPPWAIGMEVGGDRGWNKPPLPAVPFLDSARRRSGREGLWGRTAHPGPESRPHWSPGSQIPTHCNLAVGDTPRGCAASFPGVPERQAWTQSSLAPEKCRPAWVHRKTGWSSP